MELINSSLAQVSLGEPHVFENLSVTPLMSQGLARPNYQTLDEALAAGTLRITEISAQGAGPELLVSNSAGIAVLIMDGEELVGAKQNRIVNLSILVPPNCNVSLPVSCVESGRWAYDSPTFRSEDRVFYAAGRARKAADVTASMKSDGGRASRQADVWRDIEAKASRLSGRSPTSAMAAMYTSHEGRLREHVAALRPLVGQCGGVFAINGRIYGVELFDSAVTYAKLGPKLVKSYALDAIDSTAPDGESRQERNAVGFLERVKVAACQSFESVGEGEDVRMSGVGLAGGALVAQCRVVHLCAFTLDPSNGSEGSRPRSGIASAARRGRSHRGR